MGNSRGDDVSIVDMNSLKVIGDIKLADRIHGVCVQPDGKRLFVTVESDHTLRIIDTAKQTQIATVKLGGRPNQCAVTPDGKYVAVPIRDGDKVDIVDASNRKILKSLPIKEPQTFSSEAATCMVEDKVQNNGEPISMAEIDERLKLIHLAAEMLLFIRR